MEDLIATCSLPFTRILADNDCFILENESGRFVLTTGISEHYIMQHLTGEVKRDGVMLVQVGAVKKKPALLPVAILHGDLVTWVTVTADEVTDKPHVEDEALLQPFATDKGAAYADGFIDSSRTFLSYRQLMRYESYLHTFSGYYAQEFYSAYYTDFPTGPYDVRLHYYMIKGIRKHAHYVDDFAVKWIDTLYFYHGWTDPFPVYLVLKTFGMVDSWSSFAKMRLLADNKCREAIPLALRVLKDKKAHERIRHYALVVAGLDEANDAFIQSFMDENPRAFLRIWFTRCSDRFYPMVLENAKRVEQADGEDWLDDPSEVYTGAHSAYSKYGISQRGFVTLAMLTHEQVQEVAAIYLRIAEKLVKPLPEDKRLYWGNALRAFLMTLVFNKTQAAWTFFYTIYTSYNQLLYGVTAQDSNLSYLDTYWAQFLYDLVVNNGREEEFWQKLHAYAEEYDPEYSNQCFFRKLYAKVSYHFLSPADFYGIFSEMIDEDYVNVVAVWEGVTNNKPLPEDAKPLDHRWRHVFEDSDYYAWQEEASLLYELVKHRISPHPEGWTVDDWYDEQAYGEDDYDEDEDFEDYDEDDYFDEEEYWEEGDEDAVEEYTVLDRKRGNTRVKITTMDEKGVKAADAYAQEFFLWLKSVIQEDSTGVIGLLYRNQQPPVSYVFPDEADGKVAALEATDIEAINDRMKLLLEKIADAPPEPESYEESRYTGCYKMVNSYVVALGRNATVAAQEFIGYVYDTYTDLLYARELDVYDEGRNQYWLTFLTDYVTSRGILPDFFQKVEAYFVKMDAEGYWNYCHFYIGLYGKLAFEVLSPAEFYDRFYRYVESNFMFLDTIFSAALPDGCMTKERVILDGRWRNTFNKWEESWEFDIALEVFEQVKGFFPPEIPREPERFFTRFIQ